MSSKLRQDPATSTPENGEFHSLYLDFLKHYYEEEDREQAEKVAARLEELIHASPECADSIRGEEVRSLIAELRGDVAEAIRSREAEIRKILELHVLSANTPHWEYVSRQYDFGDVSDRLDLLAILYDQQGQLDRAIAVLRESMRYCESHKVPFDGLDLLRELEGARRNTERSSDQGRQVESSQRVRGGDGRGKKRRARR